MNIEQQEIMPVAHFLYPGNFPGAGGPGSHDQPVLKFQHFLQLIDAVSVLEAQCGKGMLTGSHVSVLQPVICDAVLVDHQHKRFLQLRDPLHRIIRVHASTSANAS